MTICETILKKDVPIFQEHPCLDIFLRPSLRAPHHGDQADSEEGAEEGRIS